MNTIRFLIIIIFFSICFKTTMAQYQSLAVENAAWLLHDFMEGPFVTYNWYWGYIISGDTTFNGNNYKKVYGFNCGGLNPTFPLHASPLVLAAFVRDADRKVYAIRFDDYGYCPIDSEYVLYDFSYNIGDTIKTCLAGYPNYTNTIVIDTIIPNAPPYNRKTFYGYNNSSYLYEGIGARTGLFEDLIVCFDCYYHLEDYSQNGLEGLGVLSGIDNYSSNNLDMEIVPNPFCNEFTLNYNIPKETKRAVFMLYDLYGRLIYQVELNTSINQLQVVADKVESGFYLASLLVDGKVVKTEKLIRN
jgi:hypothetical protein